MPNTTGQPLNVFEYTAWAIGTVLSIIGAGGLIGWAKLYLVDRKKAQVEERKESREDRDAFIQTLMEDLKGLRSEFKAQTVENQKLRETVMELRGQVVELKAQNADMTRMHHELLERFDQQLICERPDCDRRVKP